MTQGIGLRPLIFRLARQFCLQGWVANAPQGVVLEIEGLAKAQQQFIGHLRDAPLPYGDLMEIGVLLLPYAGYNDFVIRPSLSGGETSLFALPDIATCPECVRELFSPDNRFYRYPFVSCCRCGPRFSIMFAQPYDRIRTSMADFEMCPACLRDYREPDNRRFHAQTLACAECGPQLRLCDRGGKVLAYRHEALATAVRMLCAGKIVALKGIGGYQLLADAMNQSAVERLRLLKCRPEKPFALMVAGIDNAEALARIDAEERRALLSSAAPIVLLQRRSGAAIAPAVAPRQELLGIMLPYSPLHHLLLHDFSGPLVATSGNRSEEPLCSSDDQAFERLGEIADVFLCHNRVIKHALDDSIVRVLACKQTVLRRARGYMPIPVALSEPLPETLAAGGHLKAALAFSRGRHVILSQHLGDLDTLEAQQYYRHTLSELRQFFNFNPSRVMRDLHPGYFSSRYAQSITNDATPLQHHYTHVLSCMAEHDLSPPLLGIAWDGTGLGADGGLWGGEFLTIEKQGFTRFAHLRSFPLPGSAAAIREPRRVLAGLLYELYGVALFEDGYLHQLNGFAEEEIGLLRALLMKNLNTPRSTSAGRLFDAFAALLQLCAISSYEGQAALSLEQNAAANWCALSYPFVITGTAPLLIDWRPMLAAAVADRRNGEAALIAAKFHNTLGEMMKQVALRAGQRSIVLSGGCFQNALLLQIALQQLEGAGFTVYRHERIPPNDGGLALGQIYAAKFN